MKRLVITGMLLFWIGIAVAQQDAQYNQYIFNGMYINPAYAGYKGALYLQSGYRSQWSGVEGHPQSLSLSADAAVNNGKVGIALSIAEDRIGAQSSTSAYANYAYRLQVGESESSRLAFGLGLGFIQLGLDGNKLNPVQAGDQSIPAASATSILPDARAGIFYSSDKYFAGFSADNLFARYVARDRDPSILLPSPQPHLYLTAGSLFDLSDNIAFKPSFLIKDDLRGPTSLDLNGFILFNDRVWFGGFYRTAVTLYNKKYLQNDLHKTSALGLIAELFATPNFRIGYSFDYSLNKLRDYSYGSHELSLGLYIGDRSNQKPRCYF